MNQCQRHYAQKLREEKNMKCINRECESCGIENFKLIDEEKSTSEFIYWKCYDYIEIEKSSEQKIRKLSLVEKKRIVNTCSNISQVYL